MFLCFVPIPIFMIVISSCLLTPFIINMMTFFTSYCFWLKVYFVWYKYAIPLFVVSTCIGISSSIPSFWVCVSLKLKWISWRKHIIGSYFLGGASCFLINPATLFNWWPICKDLLSYCFLVVFISVVSFPFLFFCFFFIHFHLCKSGFPWWYAIFLF